MRTGTLAIVLALCCLVPTGARGQSRGMVAQDLDGTLMLVGAIGGSALGTVAWLGGVDSPSGPPGVVLGVAMSTLGAAAGAALARGSLENPSFVALLGGATLGALTGLALSVTSVMVFGGGDIDAAAMTALVTFSVGQGVTTVISTR